MRTLLVCLVVLAAACAPTKAPRPAPPAPPAATAPPADARRPTNLHVDHAWVKDADDPAEQSARQAAMTALRVKVAAGQPFVPAWESLGVDGTPWHVAEGETYAYEVIPAEARDLPDGSLSAVIPGDGGRHLFRIIGRDYAPE